MHYFLFLILSVSLYAESFYIIANQNFPRNSLTKKEIKQIYLDKKRHIFGKKILALNYTHDNPLRERFEKNILQKNRKNLERYWLKAHYKGHRPPKVLKTKASMLFFLQKIDTAIGYIDSNLSKVKGIKVLLEVNLP